MPHVIEKTVYMFDELEDNAKEHARSWFRDACDGDSYMFEPVIEDAAKIADILGINLRTYPVKLMNDSTQYDPCIYYSGFYSQGDGACFEGSYSYAKGSSRAIRDYAPQDTTLHMTADNLRDVQQRNFYRLKANVKHRGHYNHEYCTEIDVFDRENNYRDLNDDDVDTIQESLRDFMRWIYRSLEKEYEYQMSDETVDENIRCNEYEFDENGNRC